MKSAERNLPVAPAGGNVVPLRAMPAEALAGRGRHELAFLPAALEIVETPPSPIGRAVTLSIALFFCAALAWSWFGEIDIVASAGGRIVPTGRTKVIQPFEIGVVRAINVRDGQAVKAGEVLIELDTTMNEAERGRIASDLASARSDVARLDAALSEEPNQEASFKPIEGASAALTAMERQLLASQLAEHRAKRGAIERQIAQKQAERETIGAQIAKLDATIPVIQQRLDIRRELAARELGSKLTLLEMQQVLVEAQQELPVLRSRAREAEAAISGLVESRSQAVAEFRRVVSSERVVAEQKAAGLERDLARAEQRTRLQGLTAPVDGIVQQLAAHTVGGVVTPAQALLVLVPAERGLEVEAMLRNQDIGFVRPGQEAEVKVETFNFTRYGLLRGQVLGLSSDAIQRETPAAGAGQRAGESGGGEAKGQDLLYAARIGLDRTQMQIDENLVDLMPGMAVTVEIKTGRRSILNYLLSPVLRYGHESLRER